MPKTKAQTARVQVYLSDARVLAALTREARLGHMPLSQAAGRAIIRGMTGQMSADPDDRLLQLERSVSEHMRATTRELQIIQELLVELARAVFLKRPEAAAGDDPISVAVERRIDRLLDAAAARMVAEGKAARPVSAEATLDAAE